MTIPRDRLINFKNKKTMIKKLKYTNREGYVLPDERQYIGTVNDPIVDKLNEVIDAYNKLINKPVTTTNKQPICECCLTNEATGMHISGYSAEGFCSNCWDCIKDLE